MLFKRNYCSLVSSRITFHYIRGWEGRKLSLRTCILIFIFVDYYGYHCGGREGRRGRRMLSLWMFIVIFIHVVHCGYLGIQAAV